MLDHLLPAFKAEKILTASKSGHLFLGGELVTEKQKGSLQAAARMFRNTQLWEIMTDTLKSQAQTIMFKDAKDYQDLVNGKMMLYTIEVQENILKKIEQAK
ncbi:MAG: hypothetical protein ACREGC_00045 [Minisyncoccia bacterium]